LHLSKLHPGLMQFVALSSSVWRHDTQHNGTQRIDTQLKGPICDTQQE
jgi:hypothetical protein